MKKFIVTEESKQAAIKAFKGEMYGCVNDYISMAFEKALEALFVLEDKIEERNQWGNTFGDTLRKLAAIHKRPKPFGPRTRLRAANGDELMVICAADITTYNAVNLKTGKVIRSPWFYPIERLKDYLDEHGAVVIEEDTWCRDD